MLTTTPKLTAEHLQTEQKFKLVDFTDATPDDVSEHSQFSAMQKRRLSRLDTQQRTTDKLTLTDVIGLMESIPEKANSFASSAIYKVCLPKNRLASMWKRRGANKRDMDGGLREISLVTHVMFEAQIINYSGEKAIAIYLRDMSAFMKVRKLQ